MLFRSAILIVCSISSKVYAKDTFYAHGFKKTGDNNTSYGYTKVIAYDQNGFPLNIVVGASIGGKVWVYQSGEGEVVVMTDSEVTNAKVYHKYGIGVECDPTTTWTSK